MKKTISIFLSVILMISSIPASVISVFADTIPEIVTVTDIAELQSAHNYNNNTNKTWVYTKEGAVELNVTFSADCSLENGADYVYIYDGEDNQIKRYTGKQLASVEINVPGDTVKIKLVSDEDTNAYGFAVESVVGMTSISVETMPNTTKYLVNQEILYDGLTVKGNFDNGTSKAIENYQLSDIDNTTVGTKEVTVSYYGLTTKFNVEVYEPILTSLEIISMPAITDYYYGDADGLDLTGLELLATDENGNTFTVASGYIVSGFSNVTLGKQTITITYKNVSTTFEIAVFNSIKYTISNGTATVTGIANNNIKTLIIPSTLEGVPVTSINSNAFEYNSNLESVTLPGSITAICNSAFYGCTNLKKINMPENLQTIEWGAFCNCKNLETPVFPSSLITIDSYAFSNCTSINGELIVPDSVIRIGSSAFRDTNIETIILPFVGSEPDATGKESVFGWIFGCTSSSNVTGTVQQSPNYYYYIPNTITSIVITKQTNIPDYAFQSLCSTTSIKILGSTKSIGVMSFYNCAAESIELPNTIENIGEEAFAYCERLQSINIPEGVADIENRTFYNCVELTKINLPDSVIRIGAEAFRYCINLKKLNLSSNLQTIDYAAFNMCKSLDTVVFPDSLRSIGNSAFEDCSNISGKLIVPNSVESIGSEAFEGTKPTAIKLPFVGKSKNATGEDALFGVLFSRQRTSGSVESGYTRQFFGKGSNDYWDSKIPSTLVSVQITKQNVIPAYAFYNCSNIRRVMCSEDVSEIGNYAFYNCYYSLCVYYLKDATSWKDITIGTNNNPIKNATMYYQDCIPDFKCSDNAHTYKEDGFIVEATCTEKGYDGRICFECGATIKSNYVNALGHKYISTTVEPTCTQEGNIKYVCETCGDTYNQSLNALGHNYNTTITKQPTCTATGTKKYSCTRCSYNYTETIPAKGHNYNTTVVEPTCTNDGYYVDVCSVCSYRTTRTAGTITVDKNVFPYPESTHNYSNNMSKEYSFSYTNALSLEITFSASTKTEANYDYIYIYDSQGNQIGKYSGTTLAGKTITISGDSFKIKLTSDSSTVFYGFSIESIVAYVSNPMPALGHVYDDGVVTTEPTCYSKGTKRFTCLVCGYINYENIEPITLPDFQIDKEYTCSQIENLKKIAKNGTVKDPSGNNAVDFYIYSGTQLNPLINKLYLGYNSSTDCLVFTCLVSTEQYTETMTMEFKGYDKNAILTYHFEDKNGIINPKAQATITPQTYKEENTYTFTKIAGSSYSYLQESANEFLDLAFDGWTIMLSSCCDVMQGFLP